jgi:hypothetical protein
MSHIRYILNALKSTDLNLYNSWINEEADRRTGKLFEKAKDQHLMRVSGR